MYLIFLIPAWVCAKQQAWISLSNSTKNTLSKQTDIVKEKGGVFLKEKRAHSNKKTTGTTEKLWQCGFFQSLAYPDLLYDIFEDNLWTDMILE